ncbi:MAG: hypothetical protein GX913_09385, partial [Clostridiales bacterium]|nr:hypothetical protein [Clostridiales bacterium]
MKRKVFIMLVCLFALTACDTDSKEGITEESSLNVELEERDNVIEKQIELFSQQRDIWMEEMDYANERFCFTVADLDYDGQIELIVSNYGGTGHYTYSRFYKIDEEGILKELQTNFTEGDSQPDILEEDQITFYSSSSSEEIR